VGGIYTAQSAIKSIVNHMHTLLIQNATCIALMDDAQTELKDASLLIRGHLIEAVGSAQELLQSAVGGLTK
jgi:hypothetical protein